MKFFEEKETRYKVTRRLPELTVAETKIFTNEEDAKRQVHEWLQ